MILPVLFLALLAAPQTDGTAPPANTKPLLTLTGHGVQIYTCTDTPVGPAWTFTAPQAKLLDKNGSERGTHAAGPTWTLNDGSQVKGKVLATSPSPDPNAIPWLLLQAIDPKGSLSSIGYIRRSETKGGKAPTTGCDATHLGTTSQIDYTATYTFYTAAQ